MTKSNFWKYFRYKLSKCRAVIIFFAILNLFSTLLPAILFDVAFRRTEQEVLVGDNRLVYSTPDEILPPMFFAILINIIIIVFITIKSFRIYYKRPDMDTLGSLPVSYKERFWGDFLSVVFSNFVSFVPMYLISLFLLGDMKRCAGNILNSVYELDLTVYTTMFSAVWLMLLLVYLGTYAVTALVCSCCGKKGSSFLYSFIMMAALSGIYLVYGKELFSNVIGVEATAEVAKNISMLPPLGPIVSYNMLTQFTDWPEFKNDPFYIAIYLLLTAVFIAGAYLIGKRRRAENVGESFVFKSAYHTLTLLFMIMFIGASMAAYSNLMEDSGTLWVMLISFVVYAALEISQNKGFKGFWKTAVRFAAVFGACFAFITLVKTTHAFGIYKNLPSEGSVKEIKVSGSYFYTPGFIYPGKEYTFDEKQSVSEILGEHKELFKSDSLRTGNELKITYVLKTGQNITRQYSIGRDENENAIKSFSDAVKKLPDFDLGSLGVIDDPDLDKYYARYRGSGISDNYISGDKLEKLAELLRYDIENNYCNTEYNNNLGFVAFSEKGKRGDVDIYLIFPTYKGTLEFLNDPDNYTGAEINDTDTYRIDCSNKRFYVCVYVSTDDTSAAAKELLSYIKPISENDNSDLKNDIRIHSNIGGITYTIDPANEQAVIKAILALYSEKHINKD